MDLAHCIAGLLGIVDSSFPEMTPKRWARRCGRWLRTVGEGALTSRALAAAALAVSVSLVLYGRSRIARDIRRTASATHAPVIRGERAMAGFQPSKLLLTVFRAPVWLYHGGLGWLLGHRVMLLTHRGRKSGRVYETVLEVVHYDPRTRESAVVSGWGTRADWYRNIQASPPLEIQTGRERYAPTFRELAPEEIYPIVADYMRRLPPLAQPIAHRLGFDVEGPEEERRAHAARLLMIGFRPRST